jgi:hypothetical protein
MSEVRKEKQNPEKLQVLLSRVAKPLPSEAASTENVSAHGLHVRTERLWKSGTHLTVHSSEGQLWARGKVVYCPGFSANKFALGLELRALTTEWITRSPPSEFGQ